MNSSFFLFRGSIIDGPVQQSKGLGLSCLEASPRCHLFHSVFFVSMTPRHMDNVLWNIRRLPVETHSIILCSYPSFQHNNRSCCFLSLEKANNSFCHNVFNILQLKNQDRVPQHLHHCLSFIFPSKLPSSVRIESSHFIPSNLKRDISWGMATSSDRTGNCTHTCMTRVFHGPMKQICDLCKCAPRVGWVYICTQDLDGRLPNYESAGFFTAKNE
jgi:hypothetical protein